MHDPLDSRDETATPSADARVPAQAELTAPASSPDSARAR